MRRLTPSYVVASVAVALASTAALAQLRIQAAPGANTTASTTAPLAGATTAGPSVTAGGCTGTGGSTCTATTTNTSTTAGTSSGSTVPSETTPATAGGTVTASGTGSTAASTSPSTGASASEPFTPDFVNNAAAAAPFRTTPNTPDAMPTGAALGQSPGQTSSGTAAGNSSSGIDAGSQNLGTVNPSGNNLGNTALAPGATVAATTGYVGAAPGVNANGARVGNGGGNVAVITTPTPTPIFELTARQGAEREARRRARGEEPRVYGIAPRTDRDLTHQMPDDPIIRY